MTLVIEGYATVGSEAANHRGALPRFQQTIKYLILTANFNDNFIEAVADIALISKFFGVKKITMWLVQVIGADSRGY